ncbi:DnaJ subfamily B member 4 [Phytophthora cinnamomi]|uniref:DnaJ subfamily B member 4 n=1 Tax=Phytophthora cinnamomi TaxID=4785 RepID=UPI00355A863E|nr:DnaJ subfamily B member 4 [Phytophthora cinnamomi]
MLESQEEDVGEEPSQPQMPETQDEHEEQQTATEVEADAPAVDLKEMAKQLTKTLKHLLTTHRQLENDAAEIQEGMDELYRMQEERSQHIVGRLKNASSTILTFGDTSQDARHEPEDDDNEDRPMN